MSTDAAKNPSTISKILELIHGQRRYAFYLFLVMLLAAFFEGFGLSLVIPLLSGLTGLDLQTPIFSGVLNVVLSPFPEKYRLEGLLGLLVIAFFGKSLLIVLQHGMATHFALHLREIWAGQIFSNYMRTQYAKVVDDKLGTVVNNTIVEPLNASRGITTSAQVLSKVIVSLALLALLLATDAAKVIAVTFMAGIILYFLWGSTRRYSMRFGKKRVRLNQAISAVTTEGAAAIREIKIHGATEGHEKSMSRKLARYTVIETKFKILSRMPSHVAEFFVIVIVGLLLSYVHLTRGADIKESIPLLGFFIVVSQRLITYLSFIITERMNIVSLIPSLNLMHELIHEHDDEREQTGGETFTSLTDDIVLRKIRFSHSKKIPIFARLSLTIPLGKVTGLVGPSGCGKSTVADLILRLFEPERGEILINGRDVREWEIGSWRSKIGYVSQDPFLFNASIRENILVGRSGADDKDVIRAAKMANIYDYIVGLPDGFNTVVGDRGVKLSGGQRQRVAIARAIVREPELFIFDEATSALDSESERLIQQSMEKLSRTTTTLMIAHRISTLKNADVIYELEGDGTATPRGYDEVRRQSAL